jgi:uncharacterized cupin superfamily protein
VIPEAPIERTDHGLAAAGDGWFVVNAREARWWDGGGHSAVWNAEGKTDFPQVGINLHVVRPGDTMAMYHWEADQEDFLVLAGQGMLLVEGEERPLKPWDFVHCPAGTKHAIVAIDEPCVVLAVGARVQSVGPDWGAYSVDEAAIRHGVGVDEETKDRQKAYAGLGQRGPAAYRDGWLA